MANRKDVPEGKSRKAGQILEIDMERYTAMLDDPAMSEEHKKQVIEALWTIVVSFVELGYGVHPVQQACGKLAKKDNESGAADENALHCEDISSEP